MSLGSNVMYMSSADLEKITKTIFKHNMCGLFCAFFGTVEFAVMHYELSKIKRFHTKS